MSISQIYGDQFSQVYHGDCREVAHVVNPNSVQCVITSPPYWIVRAFEGVLPAVWGGDTTCEHTWTDAPRQLEERTCTQCGAWFGLLGLESDFHMFVAHIVESMQTVWNVLKNDGIVWLNIGDTFITSAKTRYLKFVASKPLTGFKQKDLCLIPHRVAIALQDAGWYVRSDIVWSKPNPIPECRFDRPSRSHDYIFMLTKNSKYYYDDTDARDEINYVTQPFRGDKYTNAQSFHNTIEDLGIPADKSKSEHVDDQDSEEFSEEESVENFRLESYTGKEINLYKRSLQSVWNIPIQKTSGSHLATFPEKLVEKCLLASTKEGDTVLDPFCGSGTTGIVARYYGRRFVGIDASLKYANLAIKRIVNQTVPLSLSIQK